MTLINPIIRDVDQLSTNTGNDGEMVRVAAGGLEYRTVSEVRTDLGLVIGTNVQAFHQNLTDIAGLAPGVGEDGYSITWDNTAGAFVLTEVTGGASLPVADTTAVVMGSADDTKLLRFEVDGFTTGTTRVLTPPNFDGTIATIDNFQTWTQRQTITTTSSLAFVVQSAANPNTFVVNSTSGRVGINGLPNQEFTVWGLASGGRFDITEASRLGTNDIFFQALPNTVAGYGYLESYGGAGLAVGTGGNTNPIIFLLNRVERGRFTQAGIVYTGLDAVTDAVTDVATLGHNSTATPAAGFGNGVLLRLKSSTTADQSAARIAAVWNTATHASRKADLILSAYDTAEREGLRIRGDGSAAAIGFLGAAPVARAAHIADASGDDAATVNAILVVLENLGFIATS